ncbi:5-formyltetrahydrofolate cyclo-ligase [Flavobacterium sp.]|uniref:5-formyltetrahydrofolate cyclo-ligase n=1 Tax=Flavobacterium sp. TaxID=239 RepID=UPI0037502843
MFKKELRKKYKDLRQQFTSSEIEEMSLKIANNLLKLNNLPNGSEIWNKTYYHLFLTIEAQKEINTEFILHILQGKDKEIVVAKSDFDALEMTHYLLTDNTKFKKNQYNIPEPIDGLEVPVSKIDVVFVPLLAFDIQGNRVGYGKGFYDKFLSQCHPQTIKIGLSFFEPEEIISDIFKEDIQLNYCVTLKNTYIF